MTIPPYLTLARQGKNHWWRYLIGLVIILLCWQILGVIPFSILIAIVTGDNNPATNFDAATLQFQGIGTILPYIALNLIFVALLGGIFIAVCLVHERPFRTLITPQSRINLHRFGQGFGVYFGLTALACLVEALIFPGRYQLTFQPGQFWLFLPLALILTPLQVAAEELLFRGYLMQAIGLVTRKPLLPVGLSALIFMLPHLLNPEVDVNFGLMATLYLALGLFLALITVRDNSLELAIGAHAANNLFIALIANYPNSALPSPSIFSSQLDPVFSVVSFSAIAVAFWLILLRKTTFRVEIP